MKIYDIFNLLDATATVNGLQRLAEGKREHGIKKPCHWSKIQIRAVDESGTVYRNTYKIRRASK